MIAKDTHSSRNLRNLSSSSKCDDTITNLSCVNVNGQKITVSQHYFNKPVAQPRAPKGHRRVADLTGLKGTLTKFDSP